MRVIGITGTIGSGKGEVVKYLKQKGFVDYSARDFIVREVEKRGLEVTRVNTTTVANDLRAKHAPSYIIEELYLEAVKNGRDCIIESVRALGELEFLRKHENFWLIGVDANIHTRYERVVNRKSPLDRVSFEQFVFDEKREMKSIDPTSGSIEDCINLADYKIMNDGTVAELHAKLDKVLPEILKK